MIFWQRIIRFKLYCGMSRTHSLYFECSLYIYPCRPIFYDLVASRNSMPQSKYRTAANKDVNLCTFSTCVISCKHNSECPLLSLPGSTFIHRELVYMPFRSGNFTDLYDVDFLVPPSLIPALFEMERLGLKFIMAVYLSVC